MRIVDTWNAKRRRSASVVRKEGGGRSSNPAETAARVDTSIILRVSPSGVRFAPQWQCGAAETDAILLFLPTAKQLLILFQKPLGRALFGIQFKLSGEAGACSHRKKPSLSHERCDRNSSTDVCVQFAKNSSSPRTFPPIIAGSREGTSSSLATYPPSACTRCNSILL